MKTARLVLFPHEGENLPVVLLDGFKIGEVSVAGQRGRTPFITFHGTFYETAPLHGARLVSASGVFPLGEKLSGLFELAELVLEPSWRNRLQKYYAVLEEEGRAFWGAIQQVFIGWSAENSQAVQVGVSILALPEPCPAIKPPKTATRKATIFETFRKEKESAIVVGGKEERFVVSGVDFSVSVSSLVVPTNERVYLYTFSVEPMMVRFSGFASLEAVSRIEKAFVEERVETFKVRLGKVAILAHYVGVNAHRSAALKKLCPLSVEGMLEEIKKEG